MQHNFDITNNGEIVDALIKGDEATFAMVYKSYFISLRNYATSILSDQEAAYEIVQNLFVTLWENRKKLDREKSLRNYLLRGTHNNSLRYLKTHSLSKRSFISLKFLASSDVSKYDLSLLLSNICSAVFIKYGAAFLMHCRRFSGRASDS